MILDKSHLVFLLAGLTVAGCSAGLIDGTMCTQEARAGITVDVRDSVSNALVGRGSLIIAREGAVADTSVTTLGDGPFSLLLEHSGTFTLSVKQTGYQPWARAGVQVTRGTCHVNGVSLTARLQK